MYHGIINIYKEKGYTSHDVVARLRGILSQKKIGHTGTLDPDAQGVLPVCLGSGTRLSELLMDKEKEYRVTMLLGRVTDTQDTGGKILCERPPVSSVPEVEEAILSFVGSYDQIPPMYSAIKVDGKKLYELARRGKEVERKARPVTIHEIRILSYDLPLVEMAVRCSRGTYIRTLCQDIGEKLGCGACMDGLIRTQSGMFRAQGALKLDEVERLTREGKIRDHILSVEEVLGDFPQAQTTGDAADRLLVNGCKIPAAMIKTGDGRPDDGSLFRTYTSSGVFAALYRYCRQEGCYRNHKMFYTKE